MMRKILNQPSFLPLAFFVLVMVGCATAQTPAQRVYQTTNNYNAALTIAVAYKALPPCPTVLICSEAKIVKQLQDADDLAYPALQAAQTIVRTPSATNAETAVNVANAAVGALIAITSKLAVKGQ